MKKLPFHTRTTTGNILDIEFPLHPETRDAVRIEQLVSALLEVIDKDLAVAGETGNGDVLQAVAMTLAIRAGIIHAPHETIERLSKQLLQTALDAVAASTRHAPQVGHA